MSNDWIQCSDGTRIHFYTLVQIIHQANYETDGQIIQYQIIQRAYDCFELTLVLDEIEGFLEIIQYLEKPFREKLGENIEFIIHLADHLIPSEKTERLSDFISVMSLSYSKRKEGINKIKKIGK